MWKRGESVGGQIENATPTREKVDGKDVLVFDGAQYASLPMGIVPPFGSYEIEMDIYVDKEGNQVQTLLTGTRDSFTFQLVNRIPKVMVYCNQLTETPGAKPMRVATGLRLKPWQWNNVKIRCDQNKLVVITNGVAGKAVAAPGYHRYPRATALGTSETGEFFKGKIRNFKITPR